MLWLTNGKNWFSTAIVHAYTMLTSHRDKSLKHSYTKPHPKIPPLPTTSKKPRFRHCKAYTMSFQLQKVPETQSASHLFLASVPHSSLTCLASCRTLLSTATNQLMLYDYFHLNTVSQRRKILGLGAGMGLVLGIRVDPRKPRKHL